MTWVYVTVACAAVLVVAVGVLLLIRRRRLSTKATNIEQVPAPLTVLRTVDDWGQSDYSPDLSAYEPGRVETPFPREEFFVQATPNPANRLDSRRLAALNHAAYLRRSEDQSQSPSAPIRFLQGDDGRETCLLVEPALRPSAEGALGALIDRRERVSEPDLARDGVSLRWPSELVLHFDGGIEGYIAEGLAPEFLADGRSSHRMVRTLDFALGGPGRGVASSDAAARLQLVRGVAAWVRALHAADVIHGSLNLRSAAFALDNRRVAALDYMSARVMGRGPWHNLSLQDSPSLGQAHPADGADLRRESSMDDDRKAFAHLAFALLVPEAQSMEGWLDGNDSVNGLDGVAPARLRWLWRRACGPDGGMPTLEEWADVLLAHEHS